MASRSNHCSDQQEITQARPCDIARQDPGCFSKPSRYENEKEVGELRMLESHDADPGAVIHVRELCPRGRVVLADKRKKRGSAA